MFWNLFQKWGKIFKTSSFHHSNFEIILESKLMYAHETHYAESRIGLYKTSLTHSS